jgi:hypothetical protein
MLYTINCRALDEDGFCSPMTNHSQGSGIEECGMVNGHREIVHHTTQCVQVTLPILLLGYTGHLKRSIAHLMPAKIVRNGVFTFGTDAS